MFRDLTWIPLYSRRFIVYQRGPSPPTDVIMTDRTLSWNLPTVSPTQAAISHVLVDQRVSASFPWANITQVNASDPQQLFLPDVNPGTIYYRVQVVDVTGQIGPGAEAQGNLAFDPPGVITGFTVTDS